MGGIWLWWDVILVTEAVLVVVGAFGYLAARRGSGNGHHWLMLAATVVVVVWVLAYMIMSLVAGYIRFDGPQKVFYYAFIPLILVHSLISTVALFLCGAAVSLGFKASRRADGKRRLEASPQGIQHRRVGLLTYWFFAGSAVTAYAAYAMLYFYYHPPVV